MDWPQVLQAYFAKRAAERVAIFKSHNRELPPLLERWCLKSAIMAGIEQTPEGKAELEGLFQSTALPLQVQAPAEVRVELSQRPRCFCAQCEPLWHADLYWMSWKPSSPIEWKAKDLVR